MSSRRRSLLTLLLLGGLVPPRASRAGEPYDLRVIVGDDNEAQRQILQALRRRYPSMVADGDAGKLGRAGRPVVYLAVGPAALRTALSAALDGPLISLFTSRQTYVRLLDERGLAQRRVTAIYAEPSPAQQMQLIALLYKRSVNVGTLLSGQTAYMTPLLQQAAREHKLDLALKTVAPDETLSRALTDLASSNVLLISPDSSLYTAENLRQLLESTYRRAQPVIGFSAALVGAGTLASAYSTVDDTISQLDSMLEPAAAGRLPEAQYPRYWRVAVNENVARSLNVIVDDTVRNLGNRPP